MTRALLERRRFRPARSYGAFWMWEDVVGPDLARRSQPERVDGGTLHVRVSSAPWAEELFLMKLTILKAMRERLGPGAVKDVRFRVARPGTGAPWQPPPSREPVFPSLGGEDPGSWGALPDGELGEALLSVYRHAKERGRSSCSST